MLPVTRNNAALRSPARSGMFAAVRATFSLDLMRSVVQEIGYGAASFTRATPATGEDWEQVIRPVLSGEARFTGARRVRNLLANTENITTTTWADCFSVSIAQGIDDPNGGTKAIRATFSSFGGGERVAQYNASLSPAFYSFPVYLRGSGTINIAIDNALAGGGFAQEITVNLTSSWQRFVVSGNASAEVVNGLRATVIYRVGNTTSPVDISFPQLENVTGQSNQNPAEYVSVGAPKLNAFLQSNAFTTTWTTGGTPAATQNVTGPDGATSAWTLTDDSAVALEYVTQGVALSAATHTLSIYVKRTTGAQTGYPVILCNDGTNLAAVTVDTSNAVATVWTAYTGFAVVTSSASAAVVSADYIRVSLVFAATVATWNFFICPAGTANATQATGTTAVAAQGSAVFYGASLNQGSTANPYFPVANVYPFHGACVDGVKYFTTENGNTVASNVVTEAVGVAIPEDTLEGYLPEPARTNLCLWSQEFDNASWTKVDTTVTADAIVSPDGTQTADLLTQGVAGTATAIQNVTATAGVVHTISCYVKRGNTDWIFLNLATSDGSSRGWFNVATGVLGSVAVTGGGVTPTTSIQAMPNGWYRLALSGNCGGVIALTGLQIIAVNANGTTGRAAGGTYYAWGAQFENSTNLLTSYIPTTTVAVQRNGEALLYPFAGNADASQGTCIAVARSAFTLYPASTAIVAFGSFNQGPLLGINGNAVTEQTIRDGTNVVTKTGLPSLATSSQARISSWGSAGMLITGTGATVQSGAFDGDIGSLGIGIGYIPSGGGGAEWSGPIKRVRIYKPQFTAAQMTAAVA